MSTISTTITTGITLGVAGYDSPLTITKAGYVSRTGKAAIYDYAAGSATVVNHGTILSDGGLYAIFMFKGNDFVDNTGAIKATHGDGILLDSDGGVTNRAGGLISSAGVHYAAVKEFNDSLPSTFVNYGTISGATGIYINGVDSQTIIDGGTIIGTGGTAITLNQTNDLVRLVPGKLLIEGEVYGGKGADRLEFASASSIGTLTGVGAYFVNFAYGTVDAGARWVLTGTNTFGAGVTLTNDGSISVASYDALALGPGGYLINRGDGSITRAPGGGAHGFNPTVIGLAGGPSTIDNRGIIGNAAQGVGIYLKAGGTFTNGNPNVTAASLYGSVAIYITGHRGTVTNYGTIASSPGVSNGIGIGLSAGGVVTNGALASTAALISGTGYGVLISGGNAAVTNFATITGGYDAVHLDKGGTIIEAGKIVGGSNAAIAFGTSGGYGGSNNLLVLENGFQINGAITASGTANAVELLGSATNAVTAKYNALGLSGFQTISFAPGAGNHATLAITNDASLPGTIAGFIGHHDTIDLTTLSDHGNDATANLNTLTNVLTVTGDNGSVKLHLDSEDYTGVTWMAQSDSSGGTEVTPLCFCAGTSIATPNGEVLVERLRAGDQVLTSTGAARSISWIGTGRVLATRGRRNSATPVIVRKHALATNVPHRDLHVTKGHSLYLDGVLVPVEFLINHRSILWDDHAQEVALYHVELETHDVLLANGAPAESYRDDGNRWLFRNANIGWDQPPRQPCTQVLTGGPIVDALWMRLLERTGPRPRQALTDDPDLHLCADGHRLDAEQRAGSAHIFRLPTALRSGAVRIASHAAAPAELGLARDPRVLGVGLRRIAVRAGTRFRVLEAADERLVEGFHRYEPIDRLRWTDGDAALPSGLFEGFAGSIEVVLDVCVTTQYRAVDRAAA